MYSLAFRWANYAKNDKTYNNIIKIMKITPINKYYIVQCRGCKLIHRLSADCIDFHIVSSEEREMGLEICHEAEINSTCDCGQEISVKAVCWEYPVESTNGVELTVNNCVLVLDPEFDFIHEDCQDDGNE